MVKPLKDILAEIEERQPIQRFYNGGNPHDDTPSDPGQDDTLGAEDEGAIEPSDMQRLEDAGVYDFYTPPPSIGPGSHHPRSEVNRGAILAEMEIGNEQHQAAVNQANLEQLGYIFQDPNYMKAVDKGGIWGAKDKQSFIDDTLGSKGFFEGFYNPSFVSGLATLAGLGFGIPGLGSVVGKLEDMGKNPARAAMVQNLATKGFTPQQIQQSLAEMGVKGLDKEDIEELAEGVGKGDIETTQFGDLYRDSSPNVPDEDDWIRPPVKPTTMIAEKMVEDVVPTTPGKGWSFDPSTWYPSAQGGPIETYQMGGLAGMMNRSMMDNQLMAQQQLLMNQQSGNRPIHDRPYHPRPPQFPGFVGPFGPQRPPQQPRLEPETYFHEHEGGKVTYPNFPKPFVNPPTDRNPIKDPQKPKPVVLPEPVHTRHPFEAPPAIVTQQPYSPLQPVPPISISETTATAMEPEAVQEATQTTIEEARPVPREIDIQMPENVTATLDFPEDVRGTANYRRGGSSSSVEEQLEEDDTVTREDILNKINAIYDLDLSGYSFPDKPEVSVEDWLLYKYWPRSFKDGLYIEKVTNKYSGKDQVKHLQDQEEKYGKLPSIKMDDDILEHVGYGIDSREDYDFELPSERKFIEGYDPHRIPLGWKDTPVARHGGEIPANYRRGGLAGILKSLAPMAAGWLLGPMGHIPAMLAGAGTQYALAGKKRSFLDAIKGGLSGYAGSGISRVGQAAEGLSKSGFEGQVVSGKTALGPSEFSKRLESFGDPGVADIAERGWSGATPATTGWSSKLGGYGEQLSRSGKGLWQGLTKFEPSVYKALASEASGPLAAMVGQTAITTPAEMPEFTEVEIAQIQSMTPEQRRAYIEAQRSKYKDSPMMQPTVFAPPNVDIGWQPNYAAEGGVMEIDEEMESGSFVLPADVVSNVGDGSSDSGHRRLTELFGGGDEYALGGGTGILKGPVKGVGSGLDDLIQTGIDGVRVARLSSDEFVVPKDVVRRLGNGSQKAGSEKLYDFMKDVRLQKHGTGQQPKEIHMSGLRKMV